MLQPSRKGRSPLVAAQLFGLVACTACKVIPEQIVPRQPAAEDAATPAESPPVASNPEGHDAAVSSAAAAPAQEPDGGASPPLFLRLPDPTATLAHGDEQRARLCAARRDDAVSDIFCASTPAHITSLAELLAALDIDPSKYRGERGFALIGHSTALSKRSISAINPRVFFVHLESREQAPLALAFARGERLVEIVTRTRALSEFQFYAVAFRLRCDQTEQGCSPGELLTSAVERDWQAVDVYHEQDLENTAVDCRVCHQSQGPDTPKQLRMQELDVPWTHWFDVQTQGGRALLDDYYAAHGNEPFAGIPGALIGQAQGGLLAAFVRISGSQTQPNPFSSKQIEGEVENSAPGQPADNHTPGQSPAWREIYQVALRGEAIPVPYHDVKITDPEKLVRRTQQLAAYRAGALPQSALPDVRDVFPDDDRLAEMSFAVDERLDDRALLTAACGLCHNERLDQSLSRARFHTDIERLSADARETAIKRLSLPGDDVSAMPPRRVYELNEGVRTRLVNLLRKR